MDWLMNFLQSETLVILNREKVFGFLYRIDKPILWWKERCTWHMDLHSAERNMLKFSAVPWCLWKHKCVFKKNGAAQKRCTGSISIHVSWTPWELYSVTDFCWITYSTSSTGDSKRVPSRNLSHIWAHDLCVASWGNWWNVQSCVFPRPCHRKREGCSRCWRWERWPGQSEHTKQTTSPLKILKFIDICWK